MPYLETDIEIAKSPQEVYQLAKKFEDFPQYMPEVKNIKVLERNERYSITEWQTEVEGTTIMWKEQEWFNDRELVITYKLLDGDLDKFEGDWKFLDHNGGTKVVLGVDFNFGMPALEELMLPILTIKIEENSQGMLKALKEKMESFKN